MKKFVKDHKKELIGASVATGIVIGSFVLGNRFGYSKGHSEGFEDGGYHNAVRHFLIAAEETVGDENTSKIYKWVMDHSEELANEVR